jgi:hypothetical protein
VSRVYYLRAWPRNPATGAVVPVRLAGGGRAKPYRLAGQGYRAGILSEPKFSAQFGYEQRGFSGSTSPVSAAIGFAPAAPAQLDELAQYYWPDAAIEIDAGDEAGALARVLTGTIARDEIREGRLILTAADPSVRLDKPLTDRFFAGTGGIEGPATITGALKRRAFGRVFNVEGRVLDPANNIYEFADPARPLQGFAALRDKGREGPMQVVAWQGSADATFATLQGVVVEPGGGAVAPSIACAKWWTQPAGPLTADLLGEIGAGYAEAAADIGAAILASAGGPALADIAAARLLRPAAAGIYIDSDETAAQALDRLFLGVSLLWVIEPNNTVSLRPWTFAPVETLRGEYLGRQQTIAPMKARRLGYRRNQRIHQDGEISAIVPAGEIGYEDGTSLEQARADLLARMDEVEQDVADAITEVAEAAQALLEISGDGKLDPFEKKSVLIPNARRLQAIYLLLTAQAAGISDPDVTTAVSAANSTRNDWVAMLGAITPPWDDTSQSSNINRTFYNDVLAAYEAALNALTQALRRFAQTIASAALTRAERISSDGWITAGKEKAEVLQDYNELVDRLNALVIKHDNLGNPASATPARQAAGAAVYVDQPGSLGVLLFNLNPPLSSSTTDTAVDPIVYRNRWQVALARVAEFEVAMLGLVPATVQNSINQILVLTEDGKWSAYEKRTILYRENATLESTWSLLDAKAAGIVGSAGLNTVRNAATTARNNWQNFISIQPTWPDPNVDTPINVAQGRTLLVAYEVALNDLAEALRVYTDTRVDTLQQRVAAIDSDGVISSGEKWLYVREWRALNNKYQRYVDRYIELGFPAVVQPIQAAAYNALGPDSGAPATSLGGRLGALPPPSWDLGGTDTQVPDPVALRTAWELAENAVDRLGAAMMAQPNADNTSAVINGGSVNGAIGTVVNANPKLSQLDANGRGTSRRINSMYTVGGAQQVYIPTVGNTQVGGTIVANEPGSPIWAYYDGGGGGTTIQILPHNLLDDAGTLSFGGGIYFGFAFRTIYWIYDDSGYNSGNPSYGITTNASLLNTPGRRLVGSVVTPPVGTPAGGGVSGGGGGGGGIRERYYDNQATAIP